MNKTKKTVLTILTIAGAVLLWLLSYKGAPLGGSAKKYSKDHRVFLLLTLINIKKKDRT